MFIIYIKRPQLHNFYDELNRVVSRHKLVIVITNILYKQLILMT